MKIEENLEIIAGIALEKTAENASFATYLKAQDATEIDLVVERLNATVASQVSCTDCGQCCRSMRPEASYKAMSHFVTDENYEEYKYLQGFTCKHLVDSKCTVYLERQQVCKDFPYMDVPGFTGRTVGIFQNYEICPIVYNIVEHLKEELDWSDK